MPFLAFVSDFDDEQDEHEGFKWFGPPERNTLRPLRELYCDMCVCVVSIGSESFATRPQPFIAQGWGKFTTARVPTGGP